MGHAALAWLLLCLLTAAGVAGVLLPFVPGTPLILAGAVVHKLMIPDVLSWWTIGALAVFVLLDACASLAGSLIGARWAGATRWGVLGAGMGVLAGLFYGLPGLVLGTLLGAILAEVYVAGRTVDEAWRAAMGAAVGLALSGAVRLGIASTMVALLAADCFLY